MRILTRAPQWRRDKTPRVDKQAAELLRDFATKWERLVPIGPRLGRFDRGAINDTHAPATTVAVACPAFVTLVLMKILFEIFSGAP